MIYADITADSMPEGEERYSTNRSRAAAALMGVQGLVALTKSAQ